MLRLLVWTSCAWLVRGGTVQYGSHVYRTLYDVNPDSNYHGCEANYRALPAGWMVAPNDAESRGVAQAHFWGRP